MHVLYYASDDLSKRHVNRTTAGAQMDAIPSELDLNLDSTPIITWLAQARQRGKLDWPALRRSLIARMIWQASYQRSPGLIDNVAYLVGWRIWGEQPRTTLAADILALRRALAGVGHRLAYSNDPQRKGYYVRGRPALDPKLVKGIRGAMAEVDLQQMEIIRRQTPAWRVGQAASMVMAVEEVGAYRLRLRRPQLTVQEALRLIRQRKVA
jgi:hypothetical protein